ncbi:MAG: hypothetical protein GF398_06375 [Chitinivibrionales bacterium]|nr:hypothetical protein [Chitinivibrionales bacterium]
MRILTALALVFMLLLLNSCYEGIDPVSPQDGDAPGQAELAIELGKVGSLAKATAAAEIRLSALYLKLTAQGEGDINDTFALSGHDQITITKKYENLTPCKEWTLTVESRDAVNQVIHFGREIFKVNPGKTSKVDLELLANYSMLVANFFPIPANITRCEVVLDGRSTTDSSFSAGAHSNDTVRLSYDYLRASDCMQHTIKMNVYGEYMGSTLLLYTGEISICVKSGEDKTYNLRLRWVGPTIQDAGAADINVELGTVGTVTLNGIIDSPQGSSTGDALYDSVIACNSEDVSDNNARCELCRQCDDSDEAGFEVDLEQEVENVGIDFEFKGKASCGRIKVIRLYHSRDKKSWKSFWARSTKNGWELYRGNAAIACAFKYVKANVVGCSKVKVAFKFKKLDVDE